RAPLASTSLPYTTLFRSSHLRYGRWIGCGRGTVNGPAQQSSFLVAWCQKMIDQSSTRQEERRQRRRKRRGYGPLKQNRRKSGRQIGRASGRERERKEGGG